MNETKKRGRPSKAELAAREADKQREQQALPPVTHNGDTDHWPDTYEPATEASAMTEEAMPQIPALLKPVEAVQVAAVVPQASEAAQAYALKVWSGQSDSLGRGERVKRVKAALEGQGMSFDGVKLPGDDQSA